MNPADYLEKCGWINEDKHIKAKKTGEQWKLTYMSYSPIGEYTVNYINGYLQHNYVVVTCKIRNAARPTIIYAGMPKRKHYLTIYLTERPEIETRLYYVEDSHGTIYKADIDRFTAQELARTINGTSYYNLEVKYPSPDPNQYWLWKSV